MPKGSNVIPANRFGIQKINGLPKSDSALINNNDDDEVINNNVKSGSKMLLKTLNWETKDALKRSNLAMKSYPCVIVTGVGAAKVAGLGFEMIIESNDNVNNASCVATISFQDFALNTAITEVISFTLDKGVTGYVINPGIGGIWSVSMAIDTTILKFSLASL